MNPIRRYVAICAAIIVILYLYHNSSKRAAEVCEAPLHNKAHHSTLPSISPPASRFKPGHAKPLGAAYTKTIVMSSLRSDDTSWIHQTHKDADRYVYVLDAPDPEHRVPANRGGEAMAYLTYIVEQYGNLSDTTLFLKAARFSTRDNNAVLNGDAAETVALLNDRHVSRVGFFNLKCHLDVGCGLEGALRLEGHYGGGRGDRRERTDLRRGIGTRGLTTNMWQELFPDLAVPGFVEGKSAGIRQPSGSQFAVSRERIQARPVEDYIRYRDWLVASKLEDGVLSEIFEYSWQAVFAGTHELCPKMADCYCEGYGICFQDDGELENWIEVLKRRHILQDELNKVVERGKKGDGKGGDSAEADFLRDRMGWCNDEMISRRKVAWERGSKWIGREIKKDR